jgi:thiamine-phosphate pyrophosphorylase
LLNQAPSLHVAWQSKDRKLWSVAVPFPKAKANMSTSRWRAQFPVVYPITDASLSGISHAEQVARLIQGGANILQLREKRSPARQFYQEGEAALAVARRHGVHLIINDRVDIAFALGADGVHLGQDDFPPEEARRLMGAGAIIGVSTHSVEQATRASRLPIDYVALGPVFATASKENPDPVLGLDGLRAARRALGSLPLVAIGGIDLDNAPDCIAAGADAVAVISHLLKQPAEIAARMRELITRLRACGAEQENLE